MYQFSGQQNLVTSLVSQVNNYFVLLCDLKGVVTSWHDPKAECLGYSEAEVIGQHVSNLISTEDTPGSSFIAVRTKAGGKLPMSGIMLDLKGAAGEVNGWAYILGSVASHKSADINSRALIGALENSNVLISRWDGVIEHWTLGCEKLYGFTAAEAVGQVVEDLLHKQHPAPAEQVREELITRGMWSGELKQSRKDGTAVFVSALLVRQDPSPGRLPLIVSTFSDITSRLEMQHELESANTRLKLMADELERSNEELEEFARIASHDLSAPITSTRWLVELLSTRHGKQLDEDGQRALAQVGVSLERMADLVEAVLTHAKVGKNPISTLQAADTELAVEIALENLRRDITTTDARITYDRLPQVLIGQQPLTQLFQNLLSNAIKYRLPETVPEIHISAQQTGAVWRIAVQDNGTGIETEWLERIFLPMQRRHSSKIAGSGIGLATCRKIVNRAGGRLWAESEFGCGSTFLFTLPGTMP